MARRAKGSGTRRADGRWQTSVRYTDPGTGRRETKVLYGDTQREMLRAKERFVKGLGKGVVTPPEERPLGQYVEEWIETYMADRAAGTRLIHTRNLRLYIRPEIGTTPLAQVTAAHVQRVIASMRARGLARTTIDSAVATLRGALERAYRDRWIAYNPARSIDRPRGERPNHAARALSREDHARLLAAAQGDPFELMIRLALERGLRHAEITGLTWEDVDLDAALLHVRRQARREQGGSGPYHLMPLKTAGALRTLSLSPDHVRLLRLQRAAFLRGRLEHGGEWCPLNLVFCSARGGVVVDPAIQRGFGALRKRAGIDYCRLHDLRHTFVTRLMEANVPPHVVAALAGHSSAAITLGVYSHALPAANAQALAALDADGLNCQNSCQTGT